MRPSSRVEGAQSLQEAGAREEVPTCLTGRTGPETGKDSDFSDETWESQFLCCSSFFKPLHRRVLDFDQSVPLNNATLVPFTWNMSDPNTMGYKWV